MWFEYCLYFWYSSLAPIQYQISMTIKITSIFSLAIPLALIFTCTSASSSDIAATDVYLDTRAKGLAQIMDDEARKYRTVAAGRVCITKKNVKSCKTAVAVSNEVFTAAMQTSIAASGEIIVKGYKEAREHAEIQIIKSAAATGQTCEAIGSSRDICPTCAEVMEANNVKRATAVQPPGGRPGQKK